MQELSKVCTDLAARVAIARERVRHEGQEWRGFLSIVPKPKGNGREIFWPFTKGGRGKCRACGRPRGHPIVRETKATKKAEAACIKIAVLLAPTQPLAGVVRFDVTTVLPIAPSWPQWKQDAARANRLWPTGNVGDRGNFLKMIEDVLQAACFVANDSQFCTGQVEKVYGDEPGYLLRLVELDEVTSFDQWKLER